MKLAIFNYHEHRNLLVEILETTERNHRFKILANPSSDIPVGNRYSEVKKYFTYITPIRKERKCVSTPLSPT